VSTEGARIEAPQAPKGGCAGVGRGYPILSGLRGLGERRELPQRGPWLRLGRKRIFSIF